MLSWCDLLQQDEQARPGSVDAAADKHPTNQENQEAGTEPGEKAGNYMHSCHCQYKHSSSKSIGKSTGQKIGKPNPQHVGEGEGGQQDSILTDLGDIKS